MSSSSLAKAQYGVLAESSTSSSSSSTSIYTPDNDSLVGSSATGKQSNGKPFKPSNKSPVLIKYNYYDYNGVRREQENFDMNYNAANGHNRQLIQRHLSPTFKQNLDDIVRNTKKQQAQQQSSNNYLSSNDDGSSGNASAPMSPISPTMLDDMHERDEPIVELTRRYKMSSYEQRCLRCQKTVYQMDKVGPLKDFTFYHQNCFKCRECGTKLTLKTYFNNQHSNCDKEVYCHRHCPKTPAGKLDNQSVGIRAALNAPKVFDASAASQPHAGDCYNADGSPVNGNSSAPRHTHNGHSVASDSTNCQGAPNVDARALYIQHAIQQTRLQAIYKQSQVDKKISQFINRRLEFLEPKQKMLEARHREEEDALFRVFERKWHEEESCISEQIRNEWQSELAKLLEKYKHQLSSITLGANESQRSLLSSKSAKQQQQQQLALVASINNANKSPDEQQMIELERANLEKTMTIKLDRKKETLKRKLREFERQATAELVEKQSKEMLALISIKLAEYKEEQKRKIGSDLEQFEAMESLANELGTSLQLTHGAVAAASARPIVAPQQAAAQQQVVRAVSSASKTVRQQDNAPPPPKAPKLSKMELYNSEQADELFREIDRRAINVAREDQRTFTDLVHHLTRHCLTDVEKVRAIFRWITVKNLNTMHFDASIKADTPMGLLRGIKQGSESYHVLFKRLCSYAGLHCVVIKGYSKSAGYQPGVRFDSNRFRNSWNAVYVAGAWRFVQCNWGARHLVSVAVMQDKNNNQSHAASQQQPNTGRSKRLADGSKPALSQSPNRGRRGQLHQSNYDAIGALSPTLSSSSSSSAAYSSSSSSSTCPSPSNLHCHGTNGHAEKSKQSTGAKSCHLSSANLNANDSLRYEYDDHYFLTDPDEFIYEFFPLAPEWQLLRNRPITLTEFEQLPFVRSLFFKYGLYFPQRNIKSVLYTDSSGATTIKIGMPTHMIPSLIFHYNLKYFDSDVEEHDGISLKRFVMQSVESGTSDGPNGQLLISNIVSFRVHLPENGAYILDIFANSTTPTQYITGEPMKFKSVCKFKIIAKNLKTVMISLPDCASGEYGPMKATRLFGIIPLTHENGLISVQNDKRFLEIQFRMTRPLLDFMASLHKNGYDERQLSKAIKIFIDGDIVIVTVKFFEDGQYGLDIYTRDQTTETIAHKDAPVEPKKQLLTHCCKYLINVRSGTSLTNR